MTWRKGKGQAEGLFRTNTLTFFGHRSCCRNLVGCATDHRRDSGGKNYSSSAFITAAHLGICHAHWKLSPCVFGCCDIGEERTEDERRESSIYRVSARPGGVLNMLKCVLSQRLINKEETYIWKPETRAANSVFLPTITSCLISEPQLLFSCTQKNENYKSNNCRIITILSSMKDKGYQTRE